MRRHTELSVQIKGLRISLPFHVRKVRSPGFEPGSLVRLLELPAWRADVLDQIVLRQLPKLDDDRDNLDLPILFIDSCLELLSRPRKPASKRRRGRRAPLDEFSQGRQARLECFRKNDREETPQSQRMGPSSLP